LNGQDLARFTKEDFEKITGGIARGISLYNAVQALLKDQALLKAQSMGNFLFQKQKLIVI